VQVAEEWKKQMAMPDMVFVTPHNRDKIEKRIAPAVAKELEMQQRREIEKVNAEKARIDNALSKSKR
jgi:hypothetical protein